MVWWTIVQAARHPSGPTERHIGLDLSTCVRLWKARNTAMLTATLHATFGDPTLERACSAHAADYRRTSAKRYASLTNSVRCCLMGRCSSYQKLSIGAFGPEYFHARV